ncbi:fimbrial protein [Pantoea endophytica]|uniref:Fimbrial protein n=1 Tax=Pantoea sp. BJ2 TaxID=3141322 RepID=A0AAU7U4H5_9GAMM
MKKIVALSIALCGSGMNVNAADTGKGRIDFKGAITEAACSIDPDSTRQEIDLGQITMAELNNGGMSTPRNFEINLENCVTDIESSVSVTFGGMPADGTNKLLGITGTASGAGIAITDASGKLVTLGVPTPAQPLINGNNTLYFSTHLQGMDGELRTGEFSAVSDFILTYM